MNKSSKEDGRSELSLSAKEILDKAFTNQEIVNSDDKTALNSPWLPSDWSINIDSSAAEVCFTHRRSALEARPSMLRNVPCPYCGRVVKYRHNSYRGAALGWWSRGGLPAQPGQDITDGGGGAAGAQQQQLQRGAAAALPATCSA